MLTIDEMNAILETDAEYHGWLDMNNPTHTSNRKQVATLRRYYEAWFTFRIKLWLWGARVVSTHLATVDRIDQPKQAVTVYDVYAVQTWLGFDFIAQDVCYGLAYDMQEVKRLLNTEHPYIRYASWRKKASA